MKEMSSAEAVILPEPIGARMKRARRSAGLTVEFMAERFGVSVPTVRSWEQSLHRPNNVFDRLEEWARLTNVSYTWLLTGSGPLVTYADDKYTPRIANEGQQILDLVPFPPSRRVPRLALIPGGDQAGGGD